MPKLVCPLVEDLLGRVVNQSSVKQSTRDGHIVPTGGIQQEVASQLIHLLFTSPLHEDCLVFWVLDAVALGSEQLRDFSLVDRSQEHLLGDVAKDDLLGVDQESTLSKLSVICQFIDSNQRVWTYLKDGQLLLKSRLVDIPQLPALIESINRCFLS